MATTTTSRTGHQQMEEEMPENLRIAPSDIIIGHQIGQGGFSTVHAAWWRGKSYAVKIVHTADVVAIQKEVAILSKLSHPNIMCCFGFSVDSSRDPGRCMILMELMETDLRDLMNERLKNKAEDAMPFSVRQAVDILRQIAAGMEYLHSKGVFHGDLKASNVLVSHGSHGELHVRIADFGVSQMVKLDPTETAEDFIQKKQFRGVVGSRGYQAPEVSSSSVIFSTGERRFVGTWGYVAPEFTQQGYSEWGFFTRRGQRFREVFYTAKADVYCFAITCYEIFSGRVPFESVREPDIPALVLQGIRPQLPLSLDPYFVTLLRRCWHQKPSRRPSFSEIQHTLREWSDANSQEPSSKEENREKASNFWDRQLMRLSSASHLERREISSGSLGLEDSRCSGLCCGVWKKRALYARQPK